jgi:hypothetical protein
MFPPISFPVAVDPHDPQRKHVICVLDTLQRAGQFQTLLRDIGLRAGACSSSDTACD